MKWASCVYICCRLMGTNAFLPDPSLGDFLFVQIQVHLTPTQQINPSTPLLISPIVGLEASLASAIHRALQVKASSFNHSTRRPFHSRALDRIAQLDR
ncbi:hypothetical protein BDN71DRAFT_862470 [Pleurotus eryngii]|uniref:Secreted protein n=1 Tax=Pleurotus eryngii TaxID=5323 RepID=A0A9P6DGV7_PLEER|nr:hypothetical protein BDN71DRAFT_862470 [Pleurotus eryngii]